jgi:hypothetical protein
MALPSLVSRVYNKSNLGNDGQTKKDEDRGPGEAVAMEVEEAGKVRVRSKSIKYLSPSLGV